MRNMVVRLVLIGLMLNVFCTAMAGKNPLDSLARDAGKEFKKIIVSQVKDKKTADSLWAEAERLYTGPTRFYHNLEHISNFYEQLKKCKKQIADWNALVIAAVYHDIIYGSEDRRDEERSAELAVQRLTTAGFPADFVKKVETLILATKAHALSEDNDTNLFNDADMSIVGLDREYYKRYVGNVRKEYSNSPNFDAGRKRVMQYFLNMPRIFKTDFFNKMYEASARENIKWEISTLQ
jgi:predicted metal-dependent HD superfamily phosphohydrolase